MWIKNVQIEAIDYEIKENLEWLQTLSDEVECVIHCLRDEIMSHLEDVSEENFPTMEFIETLHQMKDAYEVENHKIKEKIVSLQNKLKKYD